MSATTPAVSSRLAPAVIARYAIGSLGTGGFGTLPGLVLVYFLTDSLGIAALAAGIVVTLAKVWDVIIDPVIGTASDRSLARRGSRRPLMILGSIALPVFFALTFAVPEGLGDLPSGAWVLIAFVLTATAFSLFQVPYIALPAELTPDYDARTRLLSVRVVVLTFAILLFGAGGPILRSQFGYLGMAIVAGLVIGLGMLISSFVAPKGPPGEVPRVSLAESYRAGVSALRRSQPFRALLLTFLLQGLATGAMLAGAQYVATWVLKSENAVTLLFVALIAPALFFAPIWGVIAGRIGKERAFLFASIVFGVAALSMTLLAIAPGPWVYASVAIIGAAYAGMQSLPMAMLPDVISHDAKRHGDGQAGIFGGVWTAGETTGMALGATLLTVVLTVTGYQSVVQGQAVAPLVAQSPLALLGIVLAFSLVPAAIVALSLIPFGRYRLRKQDIELDAA
jgi:GPH family glycoside/pentoside/hexuronide:cation symporter